MFTGIVQARGRIVSVKPNPGGVRLVIDRQGWRPRGWEIHEGDSICISGVCLTVVALDDGTLAFDVIAETLARTTLGALKPGSNVNLEPSLTPNTPMGGHFVQGHVDGIGTITTVQEGPDFRITVQPPEDLMPYIIPKGSVAIDGISLTVAAVGGADFETALIPTTLQITTLAEVQVGTKVNLETDIISKTIVHWLSRQSESGASVSMNTLRHAGFVD